MRQFRPQNSVQPRSSQGEHNSVPVCSLSIYPARVLIYGDLDHRRYTSTLLVLVGFAKASAEFRSLENTRP
jgi:hypothetical protein